MELSLLTNQSVAERIISVTIMNAVDKNDVRARVISVKISMKKLKPVTPLELVLAEALDSTLDNILEILKHVPVESSIVTDN